MTFTAKKKMTLEECVKLFTTHLKPSIKEAMVRFAWGMSKMTVQEEMRQTETRGYKQLEFVEFLELICRLAILKFKGSDLESMELPEKVDYFLEDVLAIVSIDKKKPLIDNLEVSESDEDY